MFAKIQEAISNVDLNFSILGRIAALSSELYKIQEENIQKAKRFLWWHVNALMWGENLVAEVQTWLLTPPAYRGKDAPTIEEITRSFRVAPACITCTVKYSKAN